MTAQNKNSRRADSALPSHNTLIARLAKSRATQLLVVAVLATGLVLRADLLPADIEDLEPKDADGFPATANRRFALFQDDNKNPDPPPVDPEPDPPTDPDPDPGDPPPDDNKNPDPPPPDPDPDPDPDPLDCPPGEIPFSIFGGPVSCIPDPNLPDPEDPQDPEDPEDPQPGENPVTDPEQTNPDPSEEQGTYTVDQEEGVAVDRPPICGSGQPPPPCIISFHTDDEGNEVWVLPESDGGNPDDGIDSVFCGEYGDFADHSSAPVPHTHPAPFPYDHDGDPNTPDICSHASENCAWHSSCPPVPPVNLPPPPQQTAVTISSVTCVGLSATVVWTFTGPSTTLTVSVGSNSTSIAASAGSWSTTMSAAGQYAVSVAGGSSTATANVTCLPATPTGLAVVCATGTVTVRWDSVSGATYEVEGDLSYTGSATTFTSPGLGGVSYRVRVKAVVAGVGESGWSGWQSGTCPVAAPAPPTGLTLTCFGWQPSTPGYANGYYTVFASWDPPPPGQTVSFELRGDLYYTGASTSQTATVAAQTTPDPVTGRDKLVPVRVRVWLQATNSGGTSQPTPTVEDTCNPPPCPASIPLAARQEATARFADMRWESWLGVNAGSRAETVQAQLPGGDAWLLPASELQVVGGVPDAVTWLAEDRDSLPGVSFYSSRDPVSGCTWRLTSARVGLRELLYTDPGDLALGASNPDPSNPWWGEWSLAVDEWNATSAQRQTWWAAWHDRGVYAGTGVPTGYGAPASCDTTSVSGGACDISAECLAVDIPEATRPGTPAAVARPASPAGCVWVVPRTGFWEWWIEWELAPERDDQCAVVGCWVQIGRSMARFLPLPGAGGLNELNNP